MIFILRPALPPHFLTEPCYVHLGHYFQTRPYYWHLGLPIIAVMPSLVKSH